MCTDFKGFSKSLFNNQSVNVQKYKRFVIVNCAITQNLTENFYKKNVYSYCAHSSEADYTFPSIRLLLTGKKIIFQECGIGFSPCTPPIYQERSQKKN